MQFPGVLRNSMWDFQGLIKKQVEIPRSRNVCVLFFVLRISGVYHASLTQFCGIFRGAALFCPDVFFQNFQG